MALTGQRILELAKQAVFCIESRIRPNNADCSKRCVRTARSIAELLLLHCACSRFQIDPVRGDCGETALPSCATACGASGTGLNPQRRRTPGTVGWRIS